MTFSERNGIVIQAAPITIKYDAPDDFRNYLLQLMLQYDGMKNIRSCVCVVAKEPQDRNNWGANDFMKNEILDILEKCPWYRIYDIIEKFYASLRPYAKPRFAKAVNEYFIERGFGWKLENGKVTSRGDEPFEQEIAEAVNVLGEAKLQTSQTEIKEAIKDMSKRPNPDVTGAVQHAAAALECLCREITGERDKTLGEIVKSNPGILPKPLDKVVSQMYGFASEQGRHLREGEAPKFEEAELIVHLSASLCTYLVKKKFPAKDELDEILNGRFRT